MIPLKAGHEEYYWGMGNTAEAVANQFKISREDQDEFAYNSHMKALRAQWLKIASRSK